MLTLNNILREIKDVPLDRLEEVYQLVHSLTPATKSTDGSRKKIMSFAGAFSEMKTEDYKDFVSQTKKVRKDLFDRNVDI